MAAAGTGYSPDRNIDREAVCFTTTAGGDEVFVGTLRHDDTLTGPGTPGWALFDQSQTLVAATTPGLTFVDCAEEACCDQVIGEGCWDDGTDSGTYVSLRDSDGVVTVVDPVTGDPVDADDVVACPRTEYQSFVSTVGPSAAFTIPGGGTNLVGWAVRARTAGVEFTLSGTNVTMDEGEIIESSAQDDAGTLLDVPQVTAGAGESARVTWLLRA